MVGVSQRAGPELEHRPRAPAGPHAARRHVAIDPQDLAGAVQPHEVEREAHAERVHRPAAGQMQGNPAVGPEGEPDEAAEAAGDPYLHAHHRRAAGELAPRRSPERPDPGVH
jgi:hypothetical protein